MQSQQRDNNIVPDSMIYDLSQLFRTEEYIFTHCQCHKPAFEATKFYWFRDNIIVSSYLAVKDIKETTLFQIQNKQQKSIAKFITRIKI